MAVSVKYKSQFRSDRDNLYTIWVTTDNPYVNEILIPSHEFTLKEFGFKLQYQGENDEIFEPIKSSSLRFTYLLQENQDFIEVDKIIKNPSQNWYVTLLKNDVLDWFGYLKVENFLTENATPSEFELEAIDPLGMTKDLWNTDARLDSNNDIFYGSPGNGTSDDLALRFGRKRIFGNSTTRFGFMQADPSVKPEKTADYATILEHLWSLLYDVDPTLLDSVGDNEGPGSISLMVGTEHPIRTSLSSRVAHSFEELYLAISHIFSDYRTEFFAFQPSKKTILDSLRYVLTVFNCRVFLARGRYWIVQPRTYLASSFEVYNYNKNPNPLLNTTPVKESGPTSVIPNIASNLINVSLVPQANHFIKSGSSFEYLNPIQRVGVEVWNGNGKFVKAATKQNPLAISLSSYSVKKIDLEFVDINLYTRTYSSPQGAPPRDGDLKVRVNASIGSVVILSTTDIVQEVSGAPVKNLVDLMVFQRLDTQNKVITKFNGTIQSTELSFFQGLLVNNDVYMCNGMTRMGNLDEVSGEWIRIELDSTGIETNTEEVDKTNEQSNAPQRQQRIITTTDGNLIQTGGGEIVKK